MISFACGKARLFGLDNGIAESTILQIRGHFILFFLLPFAILFSKIDTAVKKFWVRRCLLALHPTHQEVYIVLDVCHDVLELALFPVNQIIEREGDKY